MIYGYSRLDRESCLPERTQLVPRGPDEDGVDYGKMAGIGCRKEANAFVDDSKMRE